MSAKAESVPSDDPNAYCRLCFSGRNLVALLSYDEERRQYFLDEITNCTGIKFEAVESQPCSICWKCAVAVEDYQLFRKRCLANDVIIRSKYPSSTTTVKHGTDEWLISIPASELPSDLNDEESMDEPLVEPMTKRKTRSKTNRGKFSSKKMDELNKGESQSTKSTTCQLCKHDFVSRQSLYAHFKEQHSERGRPHKCHLCEATFKRKSHLTDHVSSHTGEVSYACEDCGTKYSKAKSLSRHRRACHMERPSNTKPANRQPLSTDGQYKCNYCPKTFKHRPSLNFHIKTHNEVLPFVCILCDTRFATKKGMLVHRGKYHPTPMDAFKPITPSSLEPKKSLQCSFCDRSFDQRNYLTQHLKFMHPNEFVDMNEKEESEEARQETQGDTEGQHEVNVEEADVAIKVEVEENDPICDDSYNENVSEML
ncbi:zinc finger protein 37 [Aedes albopictus]|uniref:C2h2-type zn-finger protein n=1 Tax=Aedes albopictus TaxID=7160 RepID=A0ABM1ZAC3_AEDAL